MSSPKDKAEELVDKMYNVVCGGNYDAKQFALIAVDEIQDFITKYNNPFEYFKYWDEVKNEIEKL